MATQKVEILKTCCTVAGNEKNEKHETKACKSQQHSALKMEKDEVADQPEVCMVSLQQTVSLRTPSDQ